MIAFPKYNGILLPPPSSTTHTVVPDKLSHIPEVVVLKVLKLILQVHFLEKFDEKRMFATWLAE